MKRCNSAAFLVLALLSAVAQAAAQNLINVKLAGGTPGAPSGPAVIGNPGDAWNYLPGLSGRANGGGVVTNATVIKDSTGTTLSGMSMSMSLSGGDGLDSFTDNANFSPAPVLLMGNYIYENNGVNYFTFAFSGLPPNRSYYLYGLGNGNQSGQGTTWWVDVTNGHATASATANYTIGSRDATVASNEGICWVRLPATTTAAGALTFRVVRLNAAESGAGGSGRAYLNAFQLQLLSAPSITGLTNQTVIAGTTALLSPSATGVPAPAFQWRSNGTNIAGATNAALALANVQYAQNGYLYSLVATNVAGAVTNSMTLSVIVTPVIAGVTNQAVPIGTDVAIAGTVSGVPAPDLQWRRSGTNLAGATAATYVIPNAQSTDSGTYSLVASNSAGMVINSMTLTVSAGDVPPTLTGPDDQTVVQGSNVTFAASVAGLPLPTVQWRVNGADMPGAIVSSLTLSNVQYAQDGFVYSVVASNRAGLATNSAILSVLVPPVIAQPPTNVSVALGTAATFLTSASGVPAVSYQWNRNGGPITGATTSAYTLASVQGTDNGANFSVTVSNSVAVVTSSNVTLTVLSPMTGSFLPTNNSTAISPDQQLRIVFSSAPRIGSGKLYVRDASNNSLLAGIDTSQFQTFTLFSATITNAAVRSVQGSTYFYTPIAIYGKEAWITLNPTSRFAYNKTYYVNADAGLFVDAAGASFPSISGASAWRFSTRASGPATPTASTGPTNLTIALDGAGDFATLQGASDWVPQNNVLRRTITILPGVYRDNATFAQNRNNVQIIGAGPNRQSVQLFYPYAAFSTANDRGAGTLRLESSDIYVRNVTIDNAVYSNYNGVTFAGPINVVATTGNRLIFDNVLIKGGQDTLYTISGIAYFNRCEIWGSVDYIYGGALSVFDQCAIVEIRSSGGPVTAPSTPRGAPYGLTFLNCTFPRALIANGYPYDVGANTTTFMRPWQQDGTTAIINAAVDTQVTTKGWSEWDGRETTCRALEYGTMLIGGGSVTPGQRQAAGAYWLNTIDPDYVNNPSLNPTNALLFGAGGTANRTNVTINPADYTLAAIFGNPYYNLGGWQPATIPTIISQPAGQTVSLGSPASFTVAAVGLPAPAYAWLKNGVSIPNATNATFSILEAALSDNATYSVVVSNSAGVVVSSNAVLTVPAQPTKINSSVTNGALNLSWPANQIGYRLLAQTNSRVIGLASNWLVVANSATTNQATIPIGASNGSVFFRLVYP